ncbi:NrpR regulatory domain-containing protein [Methanobacterium sp. ACI-7]|uniref:NrpR regulatory domain-containing protein n=1 Tax=unclassified Methanobacterium TaxID=2627676 RepID=UPI0039C1A5F8
MPDETDRKMIEILRILADQNKVLGAKTIAEELKRKGYNLGERAVRYHMRILDEKGFTERIGYAGREITEKGLKELEKGLIYDQVDFAFSKFEGMIYQTSLNPRTGKGSVVVNTSGFTDDKKVIDIIKEVFSKGIAVSPYVKLSRVENNENKSSKQEIRLDTICGTTIDGMLVNEGIPVIPQYGGLLEVEDYIPKRFTELIAYKKTSMTPLEAFTAKEMTSVLEVARKGNGMIPANFRLIPDAARENAVKLFDELQKIGVSGLLKIGESGESVLGVPVDEDMVGIAITGGIAPLCAAKEAGCNVNIKLAENIMEFKKMEKLVPAKPVLKTTGPETNEKVKFLLSKAWNLIYNVDLDLESKKGNVIVNVSYVNNDDLDDALEIINEVFSARPEFCTSKYYKIMPHLNKEKTGIATVCSFTVDGILTKNEILTTPRYGGILEIEEKMPRFVELTAYNGSSIDPHEIYISKNMTSVGDTLNGTGRILASLREIPYLARPDALNLIEKVNDAGFSVLKVGEPSELVYNAKIERYHVGIVTPGGLNPIAAIMEEGILVEVKAVESLMKLEEMEEF